MKVEIEKRSQNRQIRNSGWLGTTCGRALYAIFEYMTDQPCTQVAVLKSNFHIVHNIGV